MIATDKQVDYIVALCNKTDDGDRRFLNECADVITERTSFFKRDLRNLTKADASRIINILKK